jgi:phosphatidylserine decarboxylase
MRFLAAAAMFCLGAAPATPHTPVVQDLVKLLAGRPAVRQSLEGAIQNARLADIASTDAFLAHLDSILVAFPTEEKEVGPKALKVYFIVSQAADDRLNRDEAFSAWLKKYVQALGKFLDTPASASSIPSFAANPAFHVADYDPGPSGWLTFNQFFARHIKPGKRPIDAARDDAVIVSPADSVFAGAWDIKEDSTVTAKGVTWKIAQLLEGSPYKDAFKNGVFTHSFLDLNDYHRYHVPVAGEIKEIRRIEGKVYMNVVRNKEGGLDVIDGEGYQYEQERGLVVIDSPTLGLVAVLPIGMSFVSSVNLTPEVGARLEKGAEFGYFAFGGSDMVMLFQSGRVSLDATVGKKYLQGQRLGHAR